MKIEPARLTCSSQTPYNRYNRYKPGVWNHPSTDANGRCMICGTIAGLRSVPNISQLPKAERISSPLSLEQAAAIRAAMKLL